MQRGPVDVLFFSFPADVDPADVVGVLREPVASHLLSIIDLVLLVREVDGSVEARDVEDERWAELAPEMAIDQHTLLNDFDVAMMASSLPQGEQGMAVVVEHAWARRLDQDLADVQAELALYVRVPPEDVEAAFAAGRG